MNDIFINLAVVVTSKDKKSIQWFRKQGTARIPLNTNSINANQKNGSERKKEKENILFKTIVALIGKYLLQPSLHESKRQ